MNIITIEKKWSSENLTNRTGGNGPNLLLFLFYYFTNIVAGL